MKRNKMNNLKKILLLFVFLVISMVHAQDSTTIQLVNNDTSTTDKYFVLDKNTQNPFELRKELTFRLFSNGKIKLSIFNFEGYEIKTLITGELNSGSHVFEWDGTNNAGNPVNSGVYKYSLQFENVQESQVIAYLR